MGLGRMLGECERGFGIARRGAEASMTKYGIRQIGHDPTGKVYRRGVGWAE